LEFTAADNRQQESIFLPHNYFMRNSFDTTLQEMETEMPRIFFVHHEVMVGWFEFGQVRY
jgi:hypothetical protein